LEGWPAKAQRPGLCESLSFQRRIELEPGLLGLLDEPLRLRGRYEPDNVDVTRRTGLTHRDHREASDRQVTNTGLIEEVERLAAEDVERAPAPLRHGAQELPVAGGRPSAIARLLG